VEWLFSNMCFSSLINVLLIGENEAMKLFFMYYNEIFKIQFC